MFVFFACFLPALSLCDWKLFAPPPNPKEASVWHCPFLENQNLSNQKLPTYFPRCLNMQYCTLAEQLYLNRRLAQNMEQSSFGKAEGQEDSTELIEICWHGRHHRCRRAVIMVPRLTSGRVWLWSQRAVCTVCHSSGSRA